ncbi:glycosyltransferase [Parvibaculum sp.]|uniref:glycosyltransferase n=1 Tax=Parvibaculum sp. TaxID=2024848 RepID=UPI002BD7EAAA|nr:glycosyltransferase [Parvibaculum sp.]HUD50421.1 glycosyltransferase [Parvibaculum sp.]
MNNSRYSGSVDGLKNGELVGWAIDNQNNELSVSVGLFSNDTLIATAQAGEFREDLLQAGIGSGKGGFRFPISRDVAKRIDALGGDCHVALRDDRNAIIGHFAFTSDLLVSAVPTRVKCHVDRHSRKRIDGWCVDLDAPDRQIVVGLYVAGELRATALADVFREDLKSAGIGTGKHGFQLEIESAIVESALKTGNLAFLRDMDTSEIDRAEIRFSAERHIEKDDPRVSAIRHLIFKDISTFDRLLRDIPKSSAQPWVPAEAAFDRLLDDLKVPDEEEPAPPTAGGLSGLSGFLDHTRFRLGREMEFDIVAAATNAEHFLHWYINAYGRMRGSLRAPLSKREIDFLNQPIVIPGQEFALTRGTWAHLFSNQTLKSSIDLNDKAWYNSAVYWWSVNAAPSLFVEDCLVPSNYANLLRSVPIHWHSIKFPLSVFMEELHIRTAGLHALDRASEDDRCTFALVVMLLSISRPDYLRYIPAGIIRDLFRPDGEGKSAFSSFLQVMMPREEPWSVSWSDYVAVLRHIGFDPVSSTFGTITARGNRVGAAVLPRVVNTDPVDVQLIGPLAKASGLSQAVRRSAAALEQTALTRNYVDFDLDNPAPEGFSNVGQPGSYRKARINLIHMNAEAVPQAFAYGPDVYTDAYNIGYFFWELNSPAACHYLALEMLDEVWVSTEYGRRIYTREGGTPVFNVGMSFEDVPAIDRPRARAFVESRIRCLPNDFVFLAVFDSFSFVQRKNPIGVIRAFQRAFKDEAGVRLLLKTQNRDSIADAAQIKIWNQIDAIVSSDHRITVINETFTYEELLDLKKGCDCYVSLHRSEGLGFGMIEAMNLRLPVVCTGYSGNMEFCSEETAWIVDYKEVELRRDEYIFVRLGQKWAEPDLDDAARQMRAVFVDAGERERRVDRAWNNVQKNFSISAIGARYKQRLDEILVQIGRQEPRGRK